MDEVSKSNDFQYKKLDQCNYFFIKTSRDKWYKLWYDKIYSVLSRELVKTITIKGGHGIVFNHMEYEDIVKHFCV